MARPKSWLCVDLPLTFLGVCFTMSSFGAEKTHTCHNRALSRVVSLRQIVYQHMTVASDVCNTVP